MKFAELVRVSTWADVEGALKRLFPGRAQRALAYRELFEELGKTAPSPHVMRVSIEEELLPPDDTVVVRVLGRDGTLQRDLAGWPDLYEDDAGSEAGNLEATFTLCSYRNSDWLGMTIEPETLARYTQDEILAWILVDMTRLGFTDGARQAVLDAIRLDAHKREMPDNFRYH